MDAQRRSSLASTAGVWIALALCAAVVVGWALEQCVPNPDQAQTFAPDWLPLAAAGFAAAGLVPLGASPGWVRVRQALRWSGLLLLVWAANGLPFDLLTMAGLIGHRTADGTVVLATVYWPGLVTRTFALAAAVAVARLVMADLAATHASTRAARWCGYAAFALALPYPLLRTHWALGGTLGLRWPGAAGEGWEPLLIAIPFVLAAVLSLFLASPPRWMPRRLLLAGGWSATVVVGMIGPAATWAFVSTVLTGGDTGSQGIEIWVFGLFYCSWLCWAIAAAAATWSYQRRCADLRLPAPTS